LRILLLSDIHANLEALEACPYSKILYGADGSSPEALWIAARRYKAVLARVLENLVAEGFTSRRDAYQVARRSPPGARTSTTTRDISQTSSGG